MAPLQVNDDLVQPRSGFGTHPHRDAEIFSYVVDGELSHADSMGNKEALGRGSVQYMSAGTGVTHSGGWGRCCVDCVCWVGGYVCVGRLWVRRKLVQQSTGRRGGFGALAGLANGLGGLCCMRAPFIVL